MEVWNLPGSGRQCPYFFEPQPSASGAYNYGRQGIGRKLVQALLEHLIAAGVAALSLEVRVSNAPAIALYEQLGFQIVGCRKKYYVNPREDAYIMRKQWKEISL